jgi:hypothetical protein
LRSVLHANLRAFLTLSVVKSLTIDLNCCLAIKLKRLFLVIFQNASCRIF